ncbi:hypothetical protein DL93DRAFT_2091209 [Clavulina sp. PMI_390]|nr:hypothetical protein DL93DRAFT_2091209 [Clavulina sp. PMI_390]
MAVPEKYRRLGEFHKYYTGASVAPILTIVIGGNHEASNYMWELYHGGWLAPNIYFLGFSGCVNVNGVRIAGASGIYNQAHYRWGYSERVPYHSGAVRSIYHVRHYDVTKLTQLSPPDIIMSHDWPQGIEHHGDLQKLLKAKSFFASDIEKGELGSPPMMQLLRKLRPKRWFSAHLHVKFEATVSHSASQADGSALPVAGTNPDEIAIDDFDEFDDPAPAAEAPPPQTATDTEVAPAGATETLFLALDKCVRGRQYLEIVDVPTAYDPTTPQPEPSSSSDPSATSATPISSTEPPAATPAPETTTPAAEEPNTEDNIEEDEINAALLAADLPTSFGGPPKRRDAPPPTASSSSTPSHLPPRPPQQQQQQQLPPRTLPELTYDLEWLAISRALHPYLSTQRDEIPLPSEQEMKEKVSEARAWIIANVPALAADNGEGKIKVLDVQQFVMTAPGPVPQRGPGRGPQMPLSWFTNPQTEAFCALIGVENKINPPPQ